MRFLGEIVSTAFDPDSIHSICTGLMAAAPGMTLPAPLLSAESRELPNLILQVAPGGDVSIEAGDFGLRLSAQLGPDDISLSAGQAQILCRVDSGASLRVLIPLPSELNRSVPKPVSIEFPDVRETARGDFVTSSIIAIMLLSKDLRVFLPAIEWESRLEFRESLKNISAWIRRRQLAYRLMVVEQAAGLQFFLPHNRSLGGEEVRDITFAYRAVAEREFNWPVESMTVSIPFPELDAATRCHRPSQPTEWSFKFEHEHVAILEQTVDLGSHTVTVSDGILANWEEVSGAGANDVASAIPLIVRSQSGQARFEFHNPPSLAEHPWDEKLKKFIMLDESLSKSLADRYNALAASTLEGLTEDEKAQITERPEFGLLSIPTEESPSE